MFLFPPLPFQMSVKLEFHVWEKRERGVGARKLTIDPIDGIRHLFNVMGTDLATVGTLNNDEKSHSMKIVTR